MCVLVRYSCECAAPDRRLEQRLAGGAGPTFADRPPSSLQFLCRQSAVPEPGIIVIVSCACASHKVCLAAHSLAFTGDGLGRSSANFPQRRQQRQQWWPTRRTLGSLARFDGACGGRGRAVVVSEAPTAWCTLPRLRGWGSGPWPATRGFALAGRIAMWRCGSRSGQVDGDITSTARGGQCCWLGCEPHQH